MSSLRSIAFEAHPEQRAILPLLAGYLRDSQGIVSHLYVSTEEDRRFYEARGNGAFASIAVAPQLHAIAPDGAHDADGDARLCDKAGLSALAREIEMATGTPLNHLVMANRHLGRGYALLGTNHPRSRESARVGYDAILRRAVHAIRFWKDEANRHGFTLVSGVSKGAAMGAAYAGVPFRQLSIARFGNYFYWADNEFGESIAIAERYRQLKSDGVASDLSMDAPYKAYTSVVKEYTAALRLPRMLHSMARRVAQQVYWRLRGYAKARGYYLSQDLRYMYRFRRDGRFLMGKATTRLQDLDGTPFVFFPLSTEPELSLSQLSPEFFFQHAAIAAVSRDLPAGVKLAVKDTMFALGRRPDGFYRDLLDLKNVVLLDVAEPGFEVVRKAAAVVTINGTAGMEAAVIGKPVMAFGRHNLYNVLDHVTKTETLHDLRGALQAMLSPEFDTARATKDGSLFLQAIADSGIDGGPFDLNRRDIVPDAFIADLAAGLLTRTDADADKTEREDLRCAP